MNTNELKEILDRARTGVCVPEEDATILALAEIGRLAVECRLDIVRMGATATHAYVSEEERDDAIDAFLAAREGKS